MSEVMEDLRQDEARRIVEQVLREARGTDSEKSDDEAPPPYAFPALLAAKLPEWRKIETAAILEKVHSVDVPYRELGRRQFCMLCLALIDRGIAPGLQGFRSGVVRKKDLTAEQQTESNDRQVLDLYWLYCQRREHVDTLKRGMKRGFKKLFTGETFDFELASKMVATKDTAALKAENLGLPADLEVELMVLRTSATREFMNGHRDRSRQAERLIRNRAMKPESRLKREHIEKHLMEYRCLDLAHKSPSRAAELYAMMTGERLTPQLVDRLRKQREWLEKDVGVTFH